MVMASIASIDFNWQPDVVKGDRRRVFTPNYVVKEEAFPTVDFFRSKFSDLPTFGMWTDRRETDDQLLEELGSGWRGFTSE